MVQPYNKTISNYSYRDQVLSKIDSFHDKCNRLERKQSHFKDLDAEVDIIELMPPFIEQNTQDSDSRNNGDR